MRLHGKPGGLATVAALGAAIAVAREFRGARVAGVDRPGAARVLGGPRVRGSTPAPAYSTRRSQYCSNASLPRCHQRPGGWSRTCGAGSA